jgi:SAM-dependent methyltransferase
MQPAPALIMDSQRWRLSSEAASHYQEHIVPVLLHGWAARLVEAANLSPECRVLDLACGTGVVARIAAERVGGAGEVVGVDPSCPGHRSQGRSPLGRARPLA